MADWASGYVSDIEYTHGYYAELNPVRIRLAFVSLGLAFPEIGSACELGFGQGLSINIHAAASTVTWWGTDFNPSQAAFAQELAKISGARVYDDAFVDFCQRPELPDFDYIALHGIWSWINDENRHVIIDFVRRKLKVGGVLYISYNTLPGWSTAAPLQHLMAESRERLSAPSLGTVRQVDQSLDFTERLINTNPLWARANPLAVEKFKSIKPQNRNYLAHEYFNQNWNLMYFSDMVDKLRPTKLSFGVSADYNDYLDALNLTPEQKLFLEEIDDKNFRESLRDYMVNRQFRKDFWIKGPRRLSAIERSESLRSQLVVLTTLRADVSLKAKGVLGQADMDGAVYNPILDLLSDYQPRTLGSMEQVLRDKGISLAHIEQAVMVLVGQGYVQPAQESQQVEACKPNAHSLNRSLLERSRGSKEMRYLASPVTGGGYAISRFQQLFLLAKLHGGQNPDAWARFAWNVLSVQGERLTHNGVTLDGPEENVEVLLGHAKTFEDKTLPIIKALQIV